MSIKIGLAGNPNCGKTTMFNALTGSSQYVGNWPGVTVEKKGGKLKGNRDVEIIDLPGIYSLSPYTLEEVVSRNFFINETPDAIINIIDASNIERNLYLTTQLLELGIPTVIALNMMDIVKSRGDKIDTIKLSKELGCPVIETSALKGKGINELVEKTIEVAKEHRGDMFSIKFSKECEQALEKIEDIISRNEISYKQVSSRWLSIKLFENDSELLKDVDLNVRVKDQIDKAREACEKELDDDSQGIVTADRYSYIGHIVAKFVVKNSSSHDSISDKIDKVVTNRFLALPIFAGIMWLIYYISVSTLGTILTDWTNDTLFGDIIGKNVAAFLENMEVADWLQGLINDGIIGGVGAVLGFVPQIMLLFLLLSILEDCGYMARVAFIMDRIFRKFGLSGKSFIPMLISSGCGVPGIMATRTIENERDRKLTIMVTTFIPCGAKLPIIALFASAIFDGASWVAPAVYFFSVFMIIFSGLLLKKTKLFVGDVSPFVMELPQYHIPSAKNVLLHMWDRGKAFIVKAGTIIFAVCGVLWFLQAFNWSLDMVADPKDSILAFIGGIIAPIFKPLGFGNWQASVASITGVLAKENVVGTFGVLFGVAEDDPMLTQNISSMFTVASGLAFLMFNMINAPCVAAIAAIKREMGSWKWMFITIGFQTGTAYVIALVINQVGSYILGYGSILGAAISVLILAFIVGVIIYQSRDIEKEKICESANC